MTSPRLTGTAAALVAQQRERINACVALARRERTGLDPERFKDDLADWLEALPPALLAAPAPVPEALLEGLLEVLVMLQRPVFLPVQPWLSQVRQELLPILSPFLAQEPRRLLASLLNALLRLAEVAAARPGRWLTMVARCAPRCPDLETLLAAGQAAAWSCGLAPYRLSALEAAATLPPAVAQALWHLPAPPDATAWQERLAALATDPWLDPEAPLPPPDRPRRLRLAGRVGGFQGFGGPFLTPPRVVPSERGLLIQDGERFWGLHADHGALVLTPAPAEPEADPWRTPSLILSPEGQVRHGDSGLAALLPELAGLSSWGSTSHTLAAASAHSHWVWVVAWEPAP